MERKRVAGRFVREGLDGDGGARPVMEKAAAVASAESMAAPRSVPAPRPKQCRTFTRARMAEALPEIVRTFVEEAKKGSIAHAKMLTNLGGLDKGEMPTPKKRRGKSTVQLLMEKLNRAPEK
jgi:hypothetical protein